MARHAAAAALLLATLCLSHLCVLTTASATRRMMAAGTAANERYSAPMTDGAADNTAADDDGLAEDDVPMATAEDEDEDVAPQTTTNGGEEKAASLAAAHADNTISLPGQGCDDYNVGTYPDMSYARCVKEAVTQEAIFIIIKRDNTCKLYRTCTQKAGHPGNILYSLPAYGAGVPGKKCKQGNFWSQSGMSALDCKIKATEEDAYAFIFRVTDGTCKLYNKCTAVFNGEREVLYILAN